MHEYQQNLGNHALTAMPGNRAMETFSTGMLDAPEGRRSGPTFVSNWFRLAEHFSKVSTLDLREATPVIEGLQGAFHANVRTPNVVSSIRVEAAKCGQIAVSTFSFGRDIEIVPRGLADSILVTTVVGGRAGLLLDNTCCEARIGTTFFSQEEDKPRFLYEPETEVLKLRFDRRRFETFCSKVIGHEVKAALRFHAMQGIQFPADRWSALLRFMLLLLNGRDEQEVSAGEISSIEELLMLTLLNGQSHSYVGHFHRAAKSATPRHYRLAVEFIHHHLATDISVIQIAAAAGCSVRSLARLFSQRGNTSPMQFVQKLRLEKIRQDLLDARQSDKTISRIVHDWGCRHLGEFNRQYRLAYGERPSDTRSRSK